MAASVETERKYAILRDLRSHPNSTAHEIQTRVQLASNVMYSLLVRLEKEGRIRRPPDSHNRWEVTR